MRGGEEGILYIFSMNENKTGILQWTEISDLKDTTIVLGTDGKGNNVEQTSEVWCRPQHCLQIKETNQYWTSDEHPDRDSNANLRK